MYNRIKHQQNTKEKRLNQIRNELESKKMVEDPDAFNPSFKPKINSSSRDISPDLDFIQRNKRWDMIKQAKLQIQRVESEEREHQICSFHPETNNP